MKYYTEVKISIEWKFYNCLIAFVLNRTIPYTENGIGMKKFYIQ